MLKNKYVTKSIDSNLKMENKKKRRDRKNCKFYRPIGKVISYCDYLGEGLQCYKVCNFFVDSSTEELRQPDVST